MIQELEIVCPKCQKEINLNFFDVLLLDEKMKEQLRKDELFSIECYNCHQKIKLNYDCLCVDDKNRYAIALSFDDNEKDNVVSLFTDKEIDYRKRIVTDSHRLLEKVYIFDNGLDDRAIEIMKCIDIVHMLKEYGTEKEIKEYFVSDQNRRYFYVLMDDESYQLEFEENMYEQIMANMEFESDQDILTIDYNWAVKKVSDLV